MNSDILKAILEMSRLISLLIEIIDKLRWMLFAVGCGLGFGQFSLLFSIRLLIRRFDKANSDRSYS